MFGVASVMDAPSPPNQAKIEEPVSGYGALKDRINLLATLSLGQPTPAYLFQEAIKVKEKDLQVPRTSDSGS